MISYLCIVVIPQFVPYNHLADFCSATLPVKRDRILLKLTIFSTWHDNGKAEIVNRKSEIGIWNVAGNLRFRTEGSAECEARSAEWNTFSHGGTETQRNTNRKSEFGDVAGNISFRMMGSAECGIFRSFRGFFPCHHAESRRRREKIQPRQSIITDNSSSQGTPLQALF